jgi:hypothetical protein
MDQMLFLLNEKMRRILRIIGPDYLHCEYNSVFACNQKFIGPILLGT